MTMQPNPNLPASPANETEWDNFVDFVTKHQVVTMLAVGLFGLWYFGRPKSASFRGNLNPQRRRGQHDPFRSSRR